MIFLSSSRLVIPSYGNLRLTISLSQDDCSIRYLEHMQAEVNLQFPRRGYLEMSSTSPGGTPSKLLYSRRIDSLTGYKNFTNWKVTSLHYWGERPIGKWSITIGNAQSRRNTRTGNKTRDTKNPPNIPLSRCRSWGVLRRFLDGVCRWDLTLNPYQTTFSSILQPYPRLDAENRYPILDNYLSKIFRPLYSHLVFSMENHLSIKKVT